jgi:hypothetical protein
MSLRKCVVERFGRTPVIAMDSISSLDPGDEGAVVVCSSHGGASSAEYAARTPLRAVFFNDAGIGKDSAGIGALEIMDRHGVPTATVSHESARIGDCLDTWENGMISHVNTAGREAGVEPHRAVRDSVRELLDRES